MGKTKFWSAVRKWSRPVHRDLSFFFSGVLLIYAASGFMLNHKRDFNSDYSIRRQEVTLPETRPGHSSNGPAGMPKRRSAWWASRETT